jgi:DNA-binding winged helix-turn-helix (wHTH) protein/tetratricopeptide (TPR) repeat protein
MCSCRHTSGDAVASNETRLKSVLLFDDHRQVTDARHISFDGWTLDPISGELARKGATVRLPPQPLAMLLELLAHAGDVVTRERLVQVLWPKGVVDFDSGLNAVVRKLRITLGDDSDAPRYIETLPRIGYRFLAHPTIHADITPLADVGTKAEPPAVPMLPPPARAGQPHRLATAGLASLLTLAAGTAAWQLWPTDDVPALATSPKTAPRRPTSERAHDLYLQGVFHRSRRDIDSSDLAIAAFEEALAEDPQYADAWAALAETLSGTAMTSAAPVTETYERARSAALRATELDDTLGHGHAALAHIYMQYDRDFERAEAEAERAQALDAHYARGWHVVAILRAWQGRTSDAFDAMRRARELEPMAPLYNANFAQLLYQTRRYDEAIEHVKPLIASQPRNDQARSLLIRSLVARGDAESALPQLSLRVSDRFSTSDAGLVYAHLGRRDDALAEVDRIGRLGAQGYGLAYDIAVVHAALGDADAGCAALEQALADHSLTLPWMRLDPRMDPLREQPCFARVSQQLYGDDFALN